MASKMYIAILDEAPDYMVPTLVAHSVVNAHINMNWFPEYRDWLENSFRKVTIRVSRAEYQKIKDNCDEWWEGSENTICEGKGCCLVILPMESEDRPHVLRAAKLWAPRKEVE